MQFIFIYITSLHFCIYDVCWGTCALSQFRMLSHMPVQSRDRCIDKRAGRPGQQLQLLCIERRRKLVLRRPGGGEHRALSLLTRRRGPRARGRLQRSLRLLRPVLAGAQVRTTCEGGIAL